MRWGLTHHAGTAALSQNQSGSRPIALGPQTGPHCAAKPGSADMVGPRRADHELPFPKVEISLAPIGEAVIT